ncbi:helix-turn-helix domain-containing protein [Pseudomonas sp. 21LCFQ02]|uniref:helix-turn-helix domain-containing protein n=1 Tax=unclassified Pseudomonas TaxID=196821 RepID=UPI002098522F|nr:MULTISPECIES: helix-turn-helix transcriptional regulator [unclassified Pseudomonas]MCO8161955.1 helix-turn-helix domain-containing protein [Pseudomonas sp. 21LCFQ010]MCO8168787.1 helix-turn-helix domain-containing protein [Pseudomonas sp. 21LCFQ02]
MTGIGPRLKRERVRLKLSQSALGAIGGVETNAQGNYENGMRYPRADYLSRVSEVGVDVSYVVTGQSRPPPANDASSAQPSENLEQVIAALHESLHGMSRNLYQMTRMLEARTQHTEPDGACSLDALCNEAESISLAALRLIYTTARLV